MSTSSPRPEESPTPSPLNNEMCELLRLPVEIAQEIYTYLPNRDIKSLRLTCSFLSATATLRLGRVFLSANPRNVEVFRAIARHEVHRARVTEIVWDDALLIEGRGETHPPKWYREACRKNLQDRMWFKSNDVERPDHVARAQQVAARLPTEEAWAHYQELLRKQREVLDSQAHIRALEGAMSSFPALRRVTITCAAHGRLFNPLYETPMIRAFPRGFNYPIPRGWPVTEALDPECPEWEDDGGTWQGSRAVLRVLARNEDGGKVTELRVDANWLETGLNSSLFEQPCPALADFEAVLARPSFKHLHLDLLVDPWEGEADMYRRGLLRQALAGAAAGRGLEHLSIRTNHTDRRHWYVPLGTIFPKSSLSRLRHFGLSGFHVKQDDLLALLAALPPSVRTIELGLIGFLKRFGTRQTLLQQIRDTLGWRDRVPRPKLAIVMDPLGYQTYPGRYVWIEEEVDAFLYRGGKNPFGEDPDSHRKLYAKPDVGVGVLKDVFEPEYERPNVDAETLADLGYCKKDLGCCKKR